MNNPLPNNLLLQTLTPQSTEDSTYSLDELFDKDPLELTKTDISKIIFELRQERKNWQIAEAKKTEPKTTRITKKVPTKTLELDLELDLS